jgi:hypothetical protein
VPYLVQNTFLSIFPAQCPAWTVTVHLPCSVFVAKHVITHHRKYTCEKRNARCFYQGLFMT